MAKAKQLELFAGRGEARALGLLGWEDALWTKPLKITLLDGTELPIDLITIRRLHAVAKSPLPPVPESASAPGVKP